MFKFGTVTKREKSEILQEIIKLYREKRLSKDEIEKLSSDYVDKQEEHYRCCIYKEKAIAEQKIKLGLGCSAAEDEFELKNIMGYKQIVHIVSAACDSCPINRFTVTEACRGCIEHKCMDVCPANAMVRVNGRAYINQSLCRECGLCKTACPYNAISEVLRPCKASCPTAALSIESKQRKAIINEEECINCGQCVTACPFGAISDKSCIIAILEKLEEKSGKNIYAVVAPAIGSQVEEGVTMGKLKSALRQVGFYDVYEASYGADMVTAVESREFAERIEKGDKFMTTSCCPAFVNYIEKEFPELKENISSTVSPMMATAKIIKKMDENATVVFIGPCIAKKNEIKKDSLRGITDYVMTFEELSALLSAYGIDPADCEDEQVSEGSVFGRNFAAGGGVSGAIAQYVQEAGLEVEFKPIKVAGISEVKKALTMAKVGKLDGNFIEGMMCEGGCIGGPANICALNKARVNLKKFNQNSKIQSISENSESGALEGVHMHVE